MPLIIKANQTLWTPLSTNTVLWYDADDSSTITLSGNTITGWTCKKTGYTMASVSATSPGSTLPTLTGDINGRQAITFDGISNAIGYLHPTDIYPSSIRVFLVVSVTSNTAQTQSIFSTQSGATSPFFYIQNNGGILRIYGGSYLDVSSASLNTPLLFMGERVGSNGIARINGAQVVSGGIGGNTSAKKDIVLGRVQSFGSYASMLVGEVVVSDGANASTEVDKIEGYLAHKWGLSLSLPANHPYKNYPPRGL